MKKRSSAGVEESLFVRELLKRSYLKKRTFRALLLKSRNPELTFEEISKRLGVKQPAAWKCWKKGRDAIFKAFFTLKIAIHAGLLDIDVVDLLIEDLQDYRLLLTGAATEEETKDRIERRTLELIRMMEA
ncbi:MAG: hypothetical protein QXU01_03935 [Candidatus Hadarchaeales archaeon]